MMNLLYDIVLHLFAGAGIGLTAAWAFSIFYKMTAAQWRSSHTSQRRANAGHARTNGPAQKRNLLIKGLRFGVGQTPSEFK